MADTKITHEQLREELESGASYREIAHKYGMNQRTIERKVAKLKATGYDPQNERYYKNPQNQLVKGYSTLIRHKARDDDSTGTVMEWVKTSKSIDQLYLALTEAVCSLTDPIKPSKIPKPKKKKYDTDIIPWFNIGDGHLGMVAYDREVGHNFDLAIAERELCAAMGQMIEENDGYERCVIQDMGDMTHYENFSAKTEASGHDVDFDSRYPKMIKTYMRTMHYIVDKALQHFPQVDIIINQGNHSRTNDIWMAEHLGMFYSKTKRVNVIDNECVFIPYRMGNTFVMCHHSDKCRPNKLTDVMITDFRHDYGETHYHYIDIGHIHHNMVRKEYAGVTIESFNQLAQADKYAHDGGWRSRSCLTVVKRSKTYGEKGRYTLTAEEVRDRLEKVKPGTNAQKRREVFTVK